MNLPISANFDQNKKAFPVGRLHASKKPFAVVMDGIEPPTQGFSVLCSTN
jgi:hypothetical protein